MSLAILSRIRSSLTQLKTFEKSSLTITTWPAGRLFTSHRIAWTAAFAPPPRAFLKEILSLHIGAEGARVEALEAPRGRSMGRGYPPPHPTRGSGERRELHQRGLGRSPSRF